MKNFVILALLGYITAVQINQPFQTEVQTHSNSRISTTIHLGESLKMNEIKGISSNIHKELAEAQKALMLAEQARRQMFAEQHHHSLAVTGDYIDSDIISQMMSYRSEPGPSGDPYLPPVTMPNITVSRSQASPDPYLPPVTMPNVTVSRSQGSGDPYLPPVTMPNITVSRSQASPDPYLPPVTMPNVTVSRSQNGPSGDPYLPPVTMPNVTISRSQASPDPYLPPVTMPNVSVSRSQTNPPQALPTPAASAPTASAPATPAAAPTGGAGAGNGTIPASPNTNSTTASGNATTASAPAEGDADEIASQSDSDKAAILTKYAKKKVASLIGNLKSLDTHIKDQFAALETVLNNIEINAEFDPESADDIAWITTEITKILEDTPEIAALEEKLGMVKDTDPVLKTVINNLKKVTNVSTMLDLKAKNQDKSSPSGLPKKSNATNATNRSNASNSTAPAANSTAAAAPTTAPAPAPAAEAEAAALFTKKMQAPTLAK